MAFRKLPNMKGMIYVPDRKPGKKKHPCTDCLSCQWCGNERCRLCRPHGSHKKKTGGDRTDRKKH